jgi:DNA polymerase-3 subunit gamma/tau
MNGEFSANLAIKLYFASPLHSFFAMQGKLSDDTKRTGHYAVMARRWRPRIFADVIGQAHIISTLANAIESGHIAHAYLFVGPRGTGKTTTARLLAMAMNAKNGPAVNFDPDDEISRSIADGSCLDVIEIDGASNNSVDQIRALRDECRYAPVACRYKTYVIDEVHMLSNAAFNALLKTLEEPPPHVKFIFATTEAHKLLPTIISRCQKFSFRPVPTAVLAKKLEEIAVAEGVTVSEEALSAIARLANGGVRDGESMLERMVMFCGGDVSIDCVNSAYGLADSGTIDAIVSALYYGDYGKLIKISKEIAAKNCDMYMVLGDVERRIHEQLEHILDGNCTYADRMIRILETIHRSKESVRSGISEVINFETALLKAAERGQSRAIDAILHDIRSLRSAIGTGDAHSATPGDASDSKFSGDGANFCDCESIGDGYAVNGNGSGSRANGDQSRLPTGVQSSLRENFRAKISVIGGGE